MYTFVPFSTCVLTSSVVPIPFSPPFEIRIAMPILDFRHAVAVNDRVDVLVIGYPGWRGEVRPQYSSPPFPLDSDMVQEQIAQFVGLLLLFSESYVSICT